MNQSNNTNVEEYHTSFNNKSSDNFAHLTFSSSSSSSDESFISSESDNVEESINNTNTIDKEHLIQQYNELKTNEVMHKSYMNKLNKLSNESLFEYEYVFKIGKIKPKDLKSMINNYEYLSNECNFHTRFNTNKKQRHNDMNYCLCFFLNYLQLFNNTIINKMLKQSIDMEVYLSNEYIMNNYIKFMHILFEKDIYKVSTIRNKMQDMVRVIKYLKLNINDNSYHNIQLKKVEKRLQTTANQFQHLSVKRLIHLRSKHEMKNNNKFISINEFKQSKIDIIEYLQLLLTEHSIDIHKAYHFQILLIYGIQIMFAPQRTQVYTNIKYKHCYIENERYILEVHKEKNSQQSKNFMIRKIVIPKCLTKYFKVFITKIRPILVKSFTSKHKHKIIENKSYLFFNPTGFKLNDVTFRTSFRNTSNLLFQKDIAPKELRTILSSTLYDILTPEKLKLYNKMVDHNENTAMIYYKYHKSTNELLVNDSPLEEIFNWIYKQRYIYV